MFVEVPYYKYSIMGPKTLFLGPYITFFVVSYYIVIVHALGFWACAAIERGLVERCTRYPP